MKKIVFKIIRFLIKLILPIVNTSAQRTTLEEAEKEISKVYQRKELFAETDIQNLEIDEGLDLSIIIPVYNGEEFLRKCLDSIVNQKTKYHFEVIAVNDGSTDSSLKILKEYENKYKIVKTIHQENGGISRARNAGINCARGKYIGLIDNDDYVAENYVETLLSRAYQKDADMVKCNHVNFSGVNYEILSEIRHDEVSISGYMGKRILEFKGYIWGGIMKRKLWQDFRFPINYWYEDMITRVVIMRKCKQFEYVDKNLYFYNVHLNNASKTVWSKKSTRCLEQYFLLEKLMEYSNKNNLPKDDACYKIILNELGPILWTRTRGLDETVRKQVFVLACHFVNQYKVDTDLKFEEKYLEKVFLRKDYRLWKLVGMYSMLGVKLQNG